MSRNPEIVYEISDILQCCAGCPQRVALMREFGSTFSRIDGYCNRECPVGGLLQMRGKELERGGRGEANHLCSRSEPEASGRTSKQRPLLAPECYAAAEVPIMA
ncbi:zinc-finger domain-containing protein [Paenibacillus sp. FSL P4-0081]|uniref:zinc-finger domain-containing protein n=1 Tax=Paenibacillus sp. FSL P4-0081 TaxID=1536769 RepID=UPI0012E0BCB6|nr:zinc-finger domain-containing protein [Paenibacillus sp. FSL P4-0081]